MLLIERSVTRGQDGSRDWKKSELFQKDWPLHLEADRTVPELDQLHPDFWRDGEALEKEEVWEDQKLQSAEIAKRRLDEEGVGKGRQSF